MTLSKNLDPRSKLVIVLCLSSMGVFIHDIYILTGVLILSIVSALALGSNLISVAVKMKRILMLLAAIALIQSIFSPSGRVLVSLWGLSIITSGGLEKGLLLMLRMSIIVVSAAIMTTSRSREIVQGLVQWKIPYEIAFMVSVGIRFLPLLSDEMRDTLTAIQLRGIELKKVPAGKRIKIYSYVFMPVVIGAIIKSQELSTAMEMKAFRAFPKRTSYMVLKMNFKDYVVISISLVLSAAVLIIYYTHIRAGGIL